MSQTLLQVKNLTKTQGTKLLFQNASFAINEDEHIGLIGANGTGKTSLFKILASQSEMDSGDYVKANILRLGYLEQESDWKTDIIVEDYLSHECIKPIWELKQLGLGLGLTEELMKKKLSSLSGGYRMRVKLLYLLGQEPNLLLLDEPTNFLDLETLLVLESFLQGFRGAFILISHDREFLRRVTDHILEIENQEVTKFPGSLDDYFEQKTLLKELLEKQALSIDQKRQSIMDFVTRFGAKATKAKQAQSKLKQLDKLEKIEIKNGPQVSRIQIPKPSHTGKQVLEVHQLSCGYGDRQILNNIDLILNRGDHLGIVGLNGAGKSTFLKTLAGEINKLGGEYKWGYQVSFSYFAQHIPEKLPLNETVLGALQLAAHPECLQQDILNMAGSLLFSGDDIYKPIKVLSGGEKSRVAIGQLLLKKSPVLLLDEPTNHLDFETVEALTNALSQYEGSIITISHDRHFIGQVATKILEINHGLLTLYPGSYDEYVWSLQKGILADRNLGDYGKINHKNTSENNASIHSEKFNYKETKKKIEIQLRQCKKELQNIDKEIDNKNKRRHEINETLIGASGFKAGELAKELHDISSTIDLLEIQMLELMEKEQILNEDLTKLN